MDNKPYEVQLPELSISIDKNMHIGNYNEVIKLCDRFLILKPDDKLAYLNKGQAYWKIGEYDKSILCYDEAINWDSNYFKAYLNRGVSYMYKSSHYNNTKEDNLKIKFANCSISDFNHFINNCNNNKDKAIALTNRAQVYMLLKDYNKAEDDFLEAINNYSDYKVAIHGIGHLYQQIYKYSLKDDDFSKAKNSLEDFLEKFPDENIPLFNLSYLYYYKESNSTKDFSELKKCISKLLNNHNGKIDYSYLIYGLLIKIYDNKEEQEFMNYINDIILSDISYYKDKEKFLSIQNNSLYYYTSHYTPKCQYKESQKTEKEYIDEINNKRKELENLYNNNIIWLSTSYGFNDPCDPPIRLLKDKNYDYLHYIMNKIKIACATTNPYNQLMWSHYANKHTGLCIEYDISNIFNNKDCTISKISYRDSIQFNLDDLLFTQENKNKMNMLDIFSIKHNSWNYEDEYRILYNGDNDNNGKELNLSIKSIYFGFNTDEQYKKLIMDIFGNSIDYHQIKSVSYNLFNFDSEKIQYNKS